MHGNILPVALETSALDYLEVNDAIERVARNKNPKLKIVYRTEADAAWRELCKLAPVAARFITSDGFHRKPDPTQFEGFADQYFKFASILLYPPNDQGVFGEIEEISPSYVLLDESGSRHRDARLVFPKSDFDAAWWGIMEPKTKPEAVAKWLRERYGAHRPPLRVEEIWIDIKDDGEAHMKDISKRTLESAIALSWH